MSATGSDQGAVKVEAQKSVHEWGIWGRRVVLGGLIIRNNPSTSPFPPSIALSSELSELPRSWDFRHWT